MKEARVIFPDGWSYTFHLISQSMGVLTYEEQAAEYAAASPGIDRIIDDSNGHLLWSR